MQFLCNHVWEHRLQRLRDHLKSGVKVITTQTMQTSYFRIAYITCSLVLLWTKLLTATSWQRNLKKTWVRENIVRESKTLLPFDLVLKWQNQNALPCAIWFALLFRALLVSTRGSVSTWCLLHCKTTAHITVQTNLLIYLGLILHGQKYSTSRCRVGWITRCNSYINVGDFLAAESPNLPHRTSWSARRSKRRIRRL